MSCNFSRTSYPNDKRAYLELQLPLPSPLPSFCHPLPSFRRPFSVLRHSQRHVAAVIFSPSPCSSLHRLQFESCLLAVVVDASQGIRKEFSTKTIYTAHSRRQTGSSTPYVEKPSHARKLPGRVNAVIFVRHPIQPVRPEAPPLSLTLNTHIPLTCACSASLRCAGTITSSNHT